MPMDVLVFTWDEFCFMVEQRYPVIRGRRVWCPSREYRVDQAEEAIRSSERALTTIRKYLRERFGV